MVVAVGLKVLTALKNATMVSLVQTALKNATQLVETATKRVVYVTRDANRDGKDFIVKMNAVQDILAKTVTVLVDIV